MVAAPLSLFALALFMANKRADEKLQQKKAAEGNKQATKVSSSSTVGDLELDAEKATSGKVDVGESVVDQPAAIGLSASETSAESTETEEGSS